MLKDHYCSDLNPRLVGETVKLAGFIHSRRDHGQIIFVDLRDSSGLCQIVFNPDNKELYRKADKLTPESVVLVIGKVKKRPKGMENKKIKSGQVEIDAQKLELLAKARTPVFEIGQDTRKVNLEKRFEYRYLDLRSKRMANNLKLRYQINSYCRQFLDRQGFIEVETPDLTKGTPEGAREFIVPSRLHQGQFYVLPQSPQQFKQLLMVSGIERYFQITRCFRDEDQRSDRQPEFTQLDIEMAYVDQDDIIILVEELVTELIGKLFPKKRFTETPFPRLTYRQAEEKYGSDRPDIRQNKKDPQEMGFVWVTDFPLMEYDLGEKKLRSTHHPFTMPLEKDIDRLEKEPEKVLAKAYDLVLNGVEVFGGSIRITDPELQRRVFRVLGLKDKEIENRFGHMLKAFEYGVPPHGGIASGQDRFIALLAGEKNINEVIAFPKTGDGSDLMMGAPSSISSKQLRELGIKIKK